MRFTLNVSGLKEVQDAQRDFSARRLNAAIATGLTRTAVEARTDIRTKMPSIFDRPKPYTLNALFVRPARANKLESQVYFKDELGTSKGGRPATKYLRIHVDGGKRRAKGFERSLQAAGHLPAGWVTVPAVGARLDAHGNMLPAQIIQILSQLRITLTAGHDRNLGFGAKGIAAQRQAGGRFFVVPPGRGTPGIYQREFIGRNTVPVVLFVRAAGYSRRFPFDDLAQAVASRRLRPNVLRAIEEQSARLRQAAGGRP